jgi:hypothetical protein
MHLRFSLIAATLICTLAAGAMAQEYCVTCTGPDASYRCLIGGDAPMAARASRGQFLCITEIAKAGGHASCSAARGQATPCPGETRTVMFPPGDPGGAPLAETPAARPMQPAPPTAPLAPLAPAKEYAPAPLPPPDQQQAVPHDPQAPGAPEEAKPNAVENFAKKTGEAVTETGNAVGNAMKKTWNCVASLFGDC